MFGCKKCEDYQFTVGIMTVSYKSGMEIIERSVENITQELI